MKFARAMISVDSEPRQADYETFCLEKWTQAQASNQSLSIARAPKPSRTHSQNTRRVSLFSEQNSIAQIRIERAPFSGDTHELFVRSQARRTRCLELDGGRRYLCTSTGWHLGKDQEGECDLARLPRFVCALLVSRWRTETCWNLDRSVPGPRRSHQARPETARPEGQLCTGYVVEPDTADCQWHYRRRMRRNCEQSGTAKGRRILDRDLR